MPIFYYKARGKNGQLAEGVAEAPNENAVAGLLSEKGLAVIAIESRVGSDFGSNLFFSFNRVKIKDLVVFFRQLAVMIEAEVPIVRALRIILKQTTNEKLKMVVAGLADEIDGGTKFSKALADFPDVFNDFYVSVVKSGETSGRLSEVMNYLADQQEKDYDLQSKVKGAMIYPIFIVCGLAVVAFIVMTFVIPQIVGMLAESGAKLPFATRALIAVSGFFQSFWLLILIFILAMIVGVIACKKTPSGRLLLDRFKVKVPIFGSIFQKIYLVRFSRSFSTLLRGGVPASRALGVVKEVVGNAVYRDIISRAIKEVEEGNPISESLNEPKYFPAMVAQMISVGEETGKTEVVLDKITDFYTRDINNSVNNLSTLIEPMVMVVLGVAVGGFVAAVILPMWQLSASM